MSKAQTAARLRELKDAGEDAEWYPTTDAIIRKVVHDAETQFYYAPKRVLDVGAGDGRVLEAFNKLFDRHGIELFAIEKAAVHIAAMPKHIQMLGTDFRQQTLIDKEMTVIFCNPPYSEYVEWAYRLIREANAELLYLVIPERWRDNPRLNEALKLRNMEAKSLGDFDFVDADRQARAKVEVVRFTIPEENSDNVDAFIEEMLPQLSVFDLPPVQKELDQRAFRDLVGAGRSVIDVLVESHDEDVSKLVESFNSLDKVDPALLRSLNITKHVVLNLIRDKIKATKQHYWTLLFNEVDGVRKRLATKQRGEYVRRMSERACIDFTAENILAVLVWVTKWANDYFDEQTVALFRSLSNDSNCVKYKSNRKLWTENGWRYAYVKADCEEGQDPLGPYKLEYRMVVTHGGIETSEYAFRRNAFGGLTEYAFNLLEDIVVTANNLRFDCDDSARNYEWVSNKSNTLKLRNGKPLVEVKAFKNGNMHFRFNPAFVLALNVEAGRLLGWIRNPAQACDEMGISEPDERDAVAKSFGAAFRIGAPTALLIGQSPVNGGIV